LSAARLTRRRLRRWAPLLRRTGPGAGWRPLPPALARLFALLRGHPLPTAAQFLPALGRHRLETPVCLAGLLPFLGRQLAELLPAFAHPGALRGWQRLPVGPALAGAGLLFGSHRLPARSTPQHGLLPPRWQFIP